MISNGKHSLLQCETLVHAIEVRLALEGEAIVLAAERATDYDLAEMAKILHRNERGVKSNEESFRHSPQFHVAIAQATHSPLFVSMVKSFVSLLRQGAALGEFVPEAQERYDCNRGNHAGIRVGDPGARRPFSGRVCRRSCCGVYHPTPSAPYEFLKRSLPGSSLIR